MGMFFIVAPASFKCVSNHLAIYDLPQVQSGFSRKKVRDVISHQKSNCLLFTNVYSCSNCLIYGVFVSKVTIIVDHM